MTKGRWFGAKGVSGKGVSGSGDPFLATLFRLLARAPSGKALTSHADESPAALDSGADASWTASLRRGDDLPPCRLSILIASGALSAMRLEPFGRSTDAAARGVDL